jgi:hypothetical protein
MLGDVEVGFVVPREGGHGDARLRAGALPHSRHTVLRHGIE